MRTKLQKTPYVISYVRHAIQTFVLTLQHATDWTELNVLLYDGTHVLTGLLLFVWLRL